MTSKYLDAEGNKKIPYKWPAWVQEGRDPPEYIRRELAWARYLASRDTSRSGHPKRDMV
jgi:hypothetical protein